LKPSQGFSSGLIKNWYHLTSRIFYKMGLTLSTWAQQVKPSPTLEIKSIAEKSRQEGKQIYDFGIGEMNPEIPVPYLLKTAIAEAVMNDATHYSPTAGDPELLEAIHADFHLFGLNYSPSQIVVCPGPKDAVFKACVAMLNPGSRRNRLVTFAPIYESYENLPSLLTGKPPIVLQTDTCFLPDPNQLADLLNQGDTIALIVLNSPNNPTGTVYPPALLEELASIIRRHEQICVLSDEVYRTIVYDGVEHVGIASSLPDQALLVGDMSKEVSGTGLRLGFIAGPEAVMQTIANVEGNASSCVNLPTQKGYAHFLRKDTDLRLRHEIRDELCVRRDVLLRRFGELVKDAVWESPSGAFYFFPDMHAYLGRRTPEERALNTDEDLAHYLLRDANVVTAPGSKFQCSDHLRFAYAVSLQTINAGIQRLADALDCLSV
jgi:aspartate aminotransferase